MGDQGTLLQPGLGGKLVGSCVVVRATPMGPGRAQPEEITWGNCLVDPTIARLDVSRDPGMLNPKLQKSCLDSSNWEERPQLTQIMMEGLYIMSSLDMPGHFLVVCLRRV